MRGLPRGGDVRRPGEGLRAAPPSSAALAGSNRRGPSRRRVGWLRCGNLASGVMKRSGGGYESAPVLHTALSVAGRS